jgi:hypothetical protein
MKGSPVMRSGCGRNALVGDRSRCWPVAITGALPAPLKIWCWQIPGPWPCSTTASTSAVHSCCTLCVDLGDSTFFAMVRAWVAEHRFGTVSTELFEEHAATYGSTGDLLARWLHKAPLPALPTA